MKAVCPNNPDHDKFRTVVHELHEWTVDAAGNYLESGNECLETVHGPDAGNTWTCAYCHARAVVTP